MRPAELDSSLRERCVTFLESLVRLQIDDPSVPVVVQVQEVPDTLRGPSVYRFFVHVPERWIGYLIGPDRGGTASALRHLLGAFVARHGSQAVVDARVARVPVDKLGRVSAAAGGVG